MPETAAQIAERILGQPPRRNGAFSKEPEAQSRPLHRSWPTPKPLPDGLSPVDEFSSEFVPDVLTPWIDDIAHRLQCPPDYVAIAAITALGAAVGRRVGIKPQAKTDWIEVLNLWGMFIGSPGMLKTPAMGEALKPLHRLEAEAAKDNELALQTYEAELAAFNLRKQVATSLTKERLKKDRESRPDIDLSDEPREPQLIRYRTNDSSYEAIGELLISNPAGIMVERDEIVSLLRQLDRDDQAVARGFYLSGWSGTQPYTFDRIIRGHRHIPAVCISVLGNTQPSRIGEYVRRANADGAGGDGLQRFGLLVWPDRPSQWRDVDEYPNTCARDAAWETFSTMAGLTEAAVIGRGAVRDTYDAIPCFRFDPAALDDFLGWRIELERRLRNGEFSAAIEGHFAKYRKLVPVLALINHLADGGQGDVGQPALLKALAFVAYLETHAHRVYGASDMVELAAAKAILAKLRKGELPEAGFTARDIHRPRWSGLTEIEHVQAGLNLLVDLDHIAAEPVPVGDRGGRPKTPYVVNPRTL